MSDIIDVGPRLAAMNDALTGFDQMRAEIDRLRKREAELLAAGDRLESQLCEAARERDRPRLTDDEREAVADGLGSLERDIYAHSDDCGGIYRDMREAAATLRAMLERLK